MIVLRVIIMGHRYLVYLMLYMMPPVSFLLGSECLVKFICIKMKRFVCKSGAFMMYRTHIDPGMSRSFHAVSHASSLWTRMFLAHVYVLT